MAGSSPHPETHEHFQHAPDRSALERNLTQGISAAEKYSNQILIGCVVLAIAVVGFIIWSRAGASRNAAAWNAFLECRAPEDYLQVAEKYPHLPVGEWARLEAGKQFLSEGLVQALTNRSSSDTNLQKAKEAYDAILKNKSGSPELRQEALYGLATALEALSDGNNTPAIEAYEALLKEFPQSPHRMWAETRVKELKTGNAESFYAWFRKQNPKPIDRTGPNDIPSLNSLLPELNIEDATTTPKDGEKAPELPADAAMPAKPEGAPAADLPADAPKAEMPAPPAADAKPAPAATKPAEEAPKSDAKPEADQPKEANKPAEAPADAKAETPPAPASEPATEAKTE